jgi:signal peptidase I
MTDSTPEQPAPLRRHRVRLLAAAIRAGVWRAAVAEGSMRPSLEPGDFLLLDPTTRRWPRRGTVVVFREPVADVLAIKRVAARGGDHVAIDGGLVHLDADEAWLLGDAPVVSIDSRSYGPVTDDRIVARAWFRYWPLRRIGRLR